MFSIFIICKNDNNEHTCDANEDRSEKTRKFHTQLLHYLFKSDNKSNHHHHSRMLPVSLTIKFSAITSRTITNEDPENSIGIQEQGCVLDWNPQLSLEVLIESF